MKNQFAASEYPGYLKRNLQELISGFKTDGKQSGYQSQDRKSGYSVRSNGVIIKS
jgi:hypothetical protein